MLSLLTPPEDEPVTAAEAKQHARIFASFTADDTYIEELISAARDKFERESGYFVAPAQYVWWPETVSAEMKLPLRPVTGIQGIQDGETVLTEETDFFLKIDKEGFGTLEFVVTPTAPIIGISVGAAECPALVKLAIKTLVAHWYNNREAFAEKAIGPVAATWESVIRNFRIA